VPLPQPSTHKPAQAFFPYSLQVCRASSSVASPASLLAACSHLFWVLHCDQQHCLPPARRAPLPFGLASHHPLPHSHHTLHHPPPNQLVLFNTTTTCGVFAEHARQHVFHAEFGTAATLLHGQSAVALPRSDGWLQRATIGPANSASWPPGPREQAAAIGAALRGSECVCRPGCMCHVRQRLHRQPPPPQEPR